MDILELLKGYLPIATVFLAAILTYIFGNRKYRYEQFRVDATEGLEKFYSPIFHEMRSIRLKISFIEKDKDQLIIGFIKKYVNQETQIYKSYNRKLIELIYELDELVNVYEMEKKSDMLEKCLNIFDDIYYIVKKEYWDIQKSLYKQYPWYKQLNQRNYLFRMFLDLSTLFYETVKFLSLCWLIVVYIMVVERFTGGNDIPNAIKENFVNITTIILFLYIFGFILRIPYYFTIIDYNKPNKLIEKINNLIWRNASEVLLRIFEVIKKIFKR